METVGARRIGTPVREGLRASYVRMMRAIENEKTRATYYTMQLTRKLHLGPRSAQLSIDNYADALRERLIDRVESREFHDKFRAIEANLAIDDQ
jgi:hypothetical protein